MIDGRLYVLIPAGRGGEKLAERLRAYGPTALSSSYADSDDLPPRDPGGELMLEVLAREGDTARELATGAAAPRCTACCSGCSRRIPRR